MFNVWFGSLSSLYWDLTGEMDRVTVLYILLCGTIAFGLPSLSKEPVECTNGDGKYPIPGTCSNEYYFCFNGVSYIQVTS